MSSIAKEPLKMAMLGQDHQNLFQDQNRDPVHVQDQDYQRRILVGLHLEGLLPDVLLLKRHCDRLENFVFNPLSSLDEIKVMGIDFAMFGR